jgi:DNA-directed RNA polymerase alpha subunit
VNTYTTQAAEEIHALIASLSNMRQDMDAAIELLTKAAAIAERYSGVKTTIDPAMLLPVDALELTYRTSNYLRKAGIHFIGDLVNHTERELLDIKNLGHKSIGEIKEVLSFRNLKLGTRIGAWPHNSMSDLSSICGRLLKDLQESIAKKAAT